jgi:hypothetical protein
MVGDMQRLTNLGPVRAIIEEKIAGVGNAGAFWVQELEMKVRWWMKTV